MKAYAFAVVGGGPAGMAAATLAAELGLATVLFDEQGAPGGQIYRGVEEVARHRGQDFALLGDDYRQGVGLVDAFRRGGAEYAPNSSVWEVTRERTLGISRDGVATLIAADRILLACGAMERPVPIPDWTLPGVMGAGAAQTLLKSAAIVPDTDTVLAGSGPLLFLVAWQLARAGVPLRAVLLTTPGRQYWRALKHLPRAVRAGPDLWKGLRWIRDLRRFGIPILGGVGNLRAEGDGRLEAVRFVHRGTPQRLAAGLLLLHEGVVPNTQLSLSIGCRHDWDQMQRCWRPATDEWGNTDTEGIAVAGDCDGISGAPAAAHLGRLAALEAAYRLGRLDRSQRDPKAAVERAALARHLRIRRFLEVLFQPAPAVRFPEDDSTVVCRCEEVTAGELRRVIALGCPGPNQAKAFTRCGMGPCQGRMCGLTVSELMAAARGVSVPEVGHYRVRPPIKPVTVGEIAALGGVEAEVSDLGGLPSMRRS